MSNWSANADHSPLDGTYHPLEPFHVPLCTSLIPHMSLGFCEPYPLLFHFIITFDVFCSPVPKFYDVSIGPSLYAS